MSGPYTDRPPDLHQGHDAAGRGQRWMMIACCIPMVAIAVVLVATGIVSPAFIVIALLCVAMMALADGRHGPRRRSPNVTGEVEVPRCECTTC